MQNLSPTTVEILLGVLAAASGVSTFLLGLLFRRMKGTKVLGVEASPETVNKLHGLAVMVVNYAEEQGRKWIKSLMAAGKTIEEIEVERLSGEQKKDIALKALQSMAPKAGIELSEEQAGIAIEAAVQVQRSIRPGPVEGTVYQSVNPPAHGSIPPPRLGSTPPLSDLFMRGGIK